MYYSDVFWIKKEGNHISAVTLHFFKDLLIGNTFVISHFLFADKDTSW